MRRHDAGLFVARGGEMSSDAIRITKTANKKQRPKDKDLAFGTVFTDHMFVVDFQEEKGWYDPRVEPYAPLSLDPATAVLHYGQSLFEGLKAFRGTDGTIRLFRPQKHVERLNRTATRMTIPQLDPDLILRSWTTLVDVDRDWVPSSVGTSLYIRPTIIASEPFLGRSEEHTSELQSLAYLVCRLLLEKKKKKPSALDKAMSTCSQDDTYLKICTG